LSEIHWGFKFFDQFLVFDFPQIFKFALKYEDGYSG